MKMRAAILLMLLCVSVAGFARPTVVLLTDFGLDNEAVGMCHGAALAVNPDVEVVDLCHNVDSYDIQLAALMLGGTTIFPRGTVFVAVVDPGVGTARRPVAIRTNRGLVYVGPDNGVLTAVIREQGVTQAVAIEPRRVNPRWEPGTFDGRDLFSPAGAILATTGSLEAIGTPVAASDLVTIDIPRAAVDATAGSIAGIHLRTDEPYGNVWTNITRDDLSSAGLRMGGQLRVTVGKRAVEMPLVVSFGHVPKGRPLAYLCSGGNLALAINMGSFRDRYALKPGARITVARISPAAARKEHQK